MIQLHKGAITVFSEKRKGTNFEIRLPLGTNHLDNFEIFQPEQMSKVMHYDEKIYTGDLQSNIYLEEEPILSQKPKEHAILIIEDNEDLRNYIKTKLSSSNEIIEAGNGSSAIQQAFDSIPDLIICDVVIPGGNGVALTNTFKSDMRTSHIPIILLTAKTGVEEQIEGMKNKADYYMTKPFNAKHLEETIKSLLANRSLLKDHFTGEISSALKTQLINKLDKKFLNEFTAVVESNLGNENFEVDHICKEIGISRVQLYRKIKALLGVNVNEYILQVRLQKAKYFLQHEEFTISKIAFKVGFHSRSLFHSI